MVSQAYLAKYDRAIKWVFFHLKLEMKLYLTFSNTISNNTF